jgi:hypothetical protein
MRPSFVLAAFFLLSACGGAPNLGLYEVPLRGAGLLSDRDRSTGSIETVSHERVADLRPGERPSPTSDEAGLWMSMDRAEADLKSSGFLVRDEELNGYLRSVLCRLAPEHCGEIRIYLVRVPHVNASMAPNGAMQIWTGLLLRTENEAQLAAIMGHEMGHYLRRHGLQRMRGLIDKTDSLLFVRLAASLTRIPAGEDLMQMATLGRIQAFSRDQEREADGYGMALMARAGYDPREVSRIWRRIIEEGKSATEDAHRSVFLAAHPTDEERCDTLEKLGEKVFAATGASESGELPLLSQLLARRADYLRDEIDLRSFERTRRLLDLMNPAEREGELRFFRGELLRLRNQEGDLGRALAEYGEAERGRGCPPEVYRSLGLVHRKMGNRRRASDAFRKYLQAAPECAERIMIMHMIEELEERCPHCTAEDT